MVAACRSESHPRGRWLPAVSLVLLIASLLEVMVGYRRSRGKSRLTCVKPSCPAITRGNYGDIRAGACGRRCHRLLQTSRKKDAHKGLKDQVKATSPNVPQVVGKSYLTGPNILPGRHDPDRGHTRRSTRRRCVRLNLPPPIPPGQRLHPRRRRTSPHSAGHDNVSACAHAGRILTPTRRPSVGSPSCAKHKCDQG